MCVHWVVHDCHAAKLGRPAELGANSAVQTCIIDGMFLALVHLARDMLPV